MIQCSDKYVIEQVTLIVECDFSTIFGEDHRLLSGNLELNRVQPSLG
jgi:hypothetical protein